MLKWTWWGPYLPPYVPPHYGGQDHSMARSRSPVVVNVHRGGSGIHWDLGHPVSVLHRMFPLTVNPSSCLSSGTQEVWG